MPTFSLPTQHRSLSQIVEHSLVDWSEHLSVDCSEILGHLCLLCVCLMSLTSLCISVWCQRVDYPVFEHLDDGSVAKPPYTTFSGAQVPIYLLDIRY